MKQSGQHKNGKQSKTPLRPVKNSGFALPALLVILILTLILFYPILHYGFLNADDPHYILENNLIKDLSWNGIKAIFSNFKADNYAPVTDLFSAVQYKLGGLDPAAFHLGSLVFHLLNVGLVFWFVLKFCTSFNPDKRNEHKEDWIVAAITALFFGIHPLQVESVAWASVRSNLFYTAFFLGSLISYIYYIRKQEKKFLLLSLIFFIISILSKAVGIGLPLILLLIDYCEKRTINRKVILEKVPFFVMAILGSIINLFLKNYSGAVYTTDFSFFERFLFGSYNFVVYIGKIFIPYNLSAYYPYPSRGGLDDLTWIFYITPLIAISILWIAYKSIKFTKAGIFGVLFYSITIFPLLQFISQGNALMAERYVYLPCIGILMIAGYWSGHFMIYKKKYRMILASILMAIVIIFSVITFNRVRIWKDSISVWTDVIKKNPNDSYGYSNRGNAKAKIKDYNGALTDCDIAVKLNPNDNEAYIFRGTVKSLSKDYSSALEDYEMAIRLKYPVKDKAYYFRGLTKSHLKDYKGAIMDFDSAIIVTSDNPEYFINRATAKYNQQDYEGAVRDNSEAIRLNTSYMGEAFFWRGAAESKLNRVAAACADFKKAKELGADLDPEGVASLCN